MVTAAAHDVPPALIDQLAPGGRLVMPIGEPYGAQELVIAKKDATGALTSRAVLPVAFVPLVEGSGGSAGS